MNRRRMNKAFSKTFGGEFGQQQQAGGNDIPYALLKGARHNGQLNLSNRSLTSVPEKVWKINTEIPEEAKVASLGDSDERWWDQVELRKLILASNQLTEIPDDVKLLPALTVLDAHDNLIETLSEELGNLTELVKLHLSHNKISQFPSTFCNIASLKTLLLTSNGISKLPEDIGYLCNIEELDLMQNQLTMLPESFGNLKHLKKLNLSKNQIESLPIGFENLTCLIDLDLSSNKLSELPTGFGKLTSLQILECRYNQINTCTIFSEVANIKQLFLGYNRIKEIQPAVLEKLPYLVSLDLRDNNISSIPENLPTLKLLERIDLTNNNLSGLPYVIGNMSLKSLSLDGNPLRGIRRDIVARGTQAILSYLKSRMPTPETEEAPIKKAENNNTISERKVLSEQQSVNNSNKPAVKEPSKEVVDQYLIATTKVLNHSSGAAVIPNSVWLPGAQVTHINISKNTVTEFPAQIFNYAETLHELDVSQNKISTIPAEIGTLTKLTFMEVSKNMLSVLPTEMKQLVHLLQINLTFNRFAAIPAILCKLPKLQTIIIANNQISEIDVDDLLQLKTLHTLDLSNNNIARIPPQLGNVSWLKSLTLDGNSFRNPRPQIMTKGTQFILSYLRDRIPR